MDAIRIKCHGLSLFVLDPMPQAGTPASTANSAFVYFPSGAVGGSAKHSTTLTIPVESIASNQTFDRCLSVWDSAIGSFQEYAVWLLDRESVTVANTPASAKPTFVQLAPESLGGPLDPDNPALWAPLNWLASLSYANSTRLTLHQEVIALTSSCLEARLNLNGGHITVLPPAGDYRRKRWTFGQYKGLELEERTFTGQPFSDAFEAFIRNPDTREPLRLVLSKFDGTSTRLIELEGNGTADCFVGSFETVRVSETAALRVTQDHVRTLYTLLSSTPTEVPTKPPDVDPVFCFASRL